MDDAVDLNLLVALDALLAEGSVTGAARRLGLSASAMSRTLARLRAATGDPLLVRAGRGLVPTPRAVALREAVQDVTGAARAVLSPQREALDPATLAARFTIRASEGFMALAAAPLVVAVGEAAPGVCLRFVPKPEKDAQPLREGPVDLEIGVPGMAAPELRRRFIFRDRFVGAVRAGHPLLERTVTPERYAACRHVVTARRESGLGPVDAALAELGLSRRIAVVVPGHPDALRLARRSDLVALVPRSCLRGTASDADAPGAGLASFPLPVATPEIVVAATWHPRLDADPAHRWLRDTVAAVCRAALREGNDEDEG
ncbi:LysR family transcriptional regulator [Mangrovibrevibacter kandeliae]|uniref:LysR family transcriptional regulator n=1 Tax=Mangrovibrevibacter kandeliae TaxID=2968473 RepID=UPI0021172EB9|nr:LysR family transcriptional regulator [Aurantimonas sp. CSK15Z-1]MCQ8784335.1 LysR family transcriptional regulator [Aurantimonas sp. CSK15Z-1]